MAAYFIVDLDIHDTAGIQEYRDRVPSVIQKHGGRYLVRGGAWQSLEGDWKPKRLVILEFPSMEHAKRFYESEEYRELKTVRLSAANTNLIVVEGVPSK